MLSTSQAYKNLMLEPVFKDRMVITISNGTDTQTLQTKDIVRESLSLNWRSSNNGVLTLGACYAASLSFSAFKNVEIAEEGQSLTITPVMYYDTGNNTEQEIPLGVFTCSKPAVYSKTTYYECYDKMLAFDEAVTDSASGTPYNMLLLACNTCGITLGNTYAQISAMTNSSRTLFVDPKYVATWRDVLAYTAIILGGYAQMGRDGKLYIRQFHKTSDMTLAKKRRNSTSFAGYHTTFAGVKCRFLAEQNFYPYEYIDEDKEYGIVIDVGDIPIINDTAATKQAIVYNIYNAISDLEYDPCEISMVGDPSIEAGDMLTTKDRDGYDQNILLTSVSFVWRKYSTITSEGANPQAGKVNTSSKRTAQKIERAVDNSAIMTATYVNASIIAVNGSEQSDVTLLRFTTARDITGIFGAEIPCYSTGEGYVEITYSDTGLDRDVVIARVHEGYNLITLVNHLHYKENIVVALKLKAKTLPLGSGSAPTLTIDRDTVRSYLFAQGIETEAPWDGIVIIDEEINVVEAVMQEQGLTESISVTYKVIEPYQLAETVAALSATVQTQSLSATITVSFRYHDDIFYCDDGLTPYCDMEGGLA